MAGNNCFPLEKNIIFNHISAIQNFFFNSSMSSNANELGNLLINYDKETF